ncbi:MAG: NADH-quinone oxidoreductase subunit L [Mobiluncus porci]|uniref:NADH-quinone oxidoreductase subunit L n=1 Tax=Mobiluncus porci TaxID=2652278 RepID=UPI0023F11C94|nr:NADH-quinone oxidoreductase subunit L [Mobiluncus porci]MDD7540599.1 NADH-quinone oxidoreductase subunit L [Mobiluncus porci]MDY5748724.1 NADH-quinone oxidoreductase subunit L [Mobiluncus porci]
MLNVFLNTLPTAGEAVSYGEATGAANYAWLMIAIPLLSSLFLLVLGRRVDKWGHWIGMLAPWASFVIGVMVLVEMLGRAPEARAQSVNLWHWLPGSAVDVSFGLLLDPLSIAFVMLVTFVGSLIHVYSVGYMEHDTDRRRFFAYLNLFVAAMLTLVLGNSYLVLFVGWEGVGLASYLLIGFWNQVHDNAVAAKKAFVMNRVGDLGLLIAMMAMFARFGSVDFATVLGSEAGVGWATFIGLFLLLAACGKSAQFPLQAWLGDAMAGPTPVSALIHAATMVTAGVYLMVRSGAIYTQTPGASLAVAIIGAVTLLFGAIVGCAKDDMKKVLAASTMSQIGYMMLGAGLGPVGWAFAIFHLIMHGFFKAQLFLSAGTVMHAMSEQVNIRRFGGLAKVMKITWFAFLVGWLAILGIPPFSGFFSKDKIIEVAFMPNPNFGEWYPWVFGLVALFGAGITAFYMSRLFFLIFHGEARWTTAEEGAPVHPHEANAWMTVPLLVLSVFSIAAGGLLSVGNLFVEWLAPVVAVGTRGTEVAHPEPVLPPTVLIILTLAVVVIGVAVAYVLFMRRPVEKAVPAAGALVTAARNDLYQDQVNDKLFVTPVMALADGVEVTDSKVVDGVVEGSGKLSLALGKLGAGLHSGAPRRYAGWTLAGTVLALCLVIVTRL